SAQIGRSYMTIVSIIQFLKESKRGQIRLGALAVRSCALLILISLTLLSSPKSRFSRHDRAYYADQALMAFVRPGLIVTIKSASVPGDGTISAVFSITDPAGLPLDIAGITTPGAVSLSFIAAYIPKGQGQYLAYTTRTASGAAIPST